MGLIGSALGAVGSIFGGMAASKAAKAARNYQLDTLNYATDVYDRTMGEDATQRSDAVSAIENTRNFFNNRTRQAAATAAVTGGTDESVAAEKAEAAKAMGNTAAQIAIAGDARKDAAQKDYMQTREKVNTNLAAIEQNKAQQIAQAASGMIKAGAKMDFGTSKVLGKSVSL